MNKKQPQQSNIEVVRICPEFAPQFREDLLWWARKNQKLWERIWDLIEAVLNDPFSGIGKPEPLKHLGSNFWSRRIDQEHRLNLPRRKRTYLIFTSSFSLRRSLTYLS